jgi:hypothetical protein
MPESAGHFSPVGHFDPTLQAALGGQKKQALHVESLLEMD